MQDTLLANYLLAFLHYKNIYLVPAEPLNLMQSSCSATSFQVTWTEDAVKPTKYQIRFNDNLFVDVEGTSWNVSSNLSAGSNYSVEIKAVLDCPNSDSERFESEIVSLMVYTGNKQSEHFILCK